ncbi:hypothetical protein [Rhizobium laguerreae]|uniref:hypothetical protein n=1 Tax=Rhizobium laguerreae TaxID=1076926 RepID=UPI0013F15659|nr:hypothetical protein [Rhizobium laguerreae]
MEINGTSALVVGGASGLGEAAAKPMTDQKAGLIVTETNPALQVKHFRMSVYSGNL